ncbi:MAG: L-seryl-tRNA(Sec) selenium transferase [Nitriliruptoraceae bacterium]
MGEHADVRASLPKVDTVLSGLDDSVSRHGRVAVVAAVRQVLAAARDTAATDPTLPSGDAIADQVRALLDIKRAALLSPVINATGVVLHTNLGRAPLSEAAQAAVVAACGPTNLEFDVATGGRGSRTGELGALLATVCHSEDATVVNNGAAALMLVLAALATGRDTIVSRGELIEIGGSYRLPDVMATAGTRLVEVGTTNRTRIADFADAVGDDTGVLLKVHRSNFTINGFTEDADFDALVALGRDHHVPVVYDIGSGLLTAQPGPLANEPNVADAVKAGADLIIFSGDKLLGGPQAGIILGRSDLIARCRKHPLARALRIDKLQRAALEATVLAYLHEERPQAIPAVRMIDLPVALLEQRAVTLARRLGATATALTSVIGGGTTPGVELPSFGVRLVTDGSPEALMARLRHGTPAVVARIDDDAVVLDLRSVPETADEALFEAVSRARG